MPKIFIINEPLRKNDETGEYERFLPMESAHDFGEVVKLTADGNPGSNLQGAMRCIREGLESWRDGDFIVLVGDQALLAYAASVVGKKLARSKGSLRFLRWERRQSSYAPLFMREPEIITGE